MLGTLSAICSYKAREELLLNVKPLGFIQVRFIYASSFRNL